MQWCSGSVVRTMPASGLYSLCMAWSWGWLRGVCRSITSLATGRFLMGLEGVRCGVCLVIVVPISDWCASA